MAALELHEELTALSHCLKIPDEVLKKGNERMQEIFLLLQKKSRYRLDRCRLTGGVGKKTSNLITFDFDCTIYVNDVDPPFEKLLDEWDDILILNFRDIIIEKKLTSRSIQFKIEEFEFDILPAPNYAGPNNDISQQANSIWKIIKSQYPEEGKKISDAYSSGLSELALQFIKKQSAFIHDLCRLAKFWNCTISFEGYVSGRSTIIESLAVKAGQEEEQAAINSDRCMLRAFRRFLFCLTKYEQIGVIFTDFYERTPVPVYKKPYLIDPSNPYNNLLTPKHDSFLSLLRTCSQETLDRLEKCEKNFNIGFEKLFDPQPELRNLFPDNMNINSIDTMISSCQNCNEKLPKLIVRRETFNSAILEHMKNSMACVLKHLSNTFRATSEKEIRRVVNKETQKLISRSLYKQDSSWCPTTKEHEEYDITFILPLNTKEHDAIYISMNK